MRQCTAGPDGRDPARAGAPLADAVLVGGAVRDVLLGRTPSDLDWLVADPEGVARAVADAWGGSLVALDPERGHWRVVVGARTWDFAAPRAASIEDDLRRRDLTVNALAWRPRDETLIDPSTWVLDHALLSRPGNDLVQLALFGDYATNLALYPAVQRYFRQSQVPLLAVWGRGDPVFGPAGAQAFATDLPHAEIHLVDGGHFLLESALAETTALIRKFLSAVLPGDGGDCAPGRTRPGCSRTGSGTP